MAIFSVALIATVSPAQTRAQLQVLPQEDEPRIQSAKNVTALDALDAIDGIPSSAVVETTSDSGAPAQMANEKPEAPAPKIATDADAAQQTGSSSGGNSSQQNPTGPPSNPTGQQDDNPKRILGFIPNFQTKNDDPGNQQPLTVKQK